MIYVPAHFGSVDDHRPFARQVRTLSPFTTVSPPSQLYSAIEPNVVPVTSILTRAFIGSGGKPQSTTITFEAGDYNFHVDYNYYTLYTLRLHAYIKLINGTNYGYVCHTNLHNQSLMPC